MATVTAPVADFTGEVAGVSFHKGRASTTDPKAIAYFRRHGYSVDGSTPEAEPEPADPRYVGLPADFDSLSEEDVERFQSWIMSRVSGISPVGTTLRDAAVDPKDGDYLLPTNAGEANPHGPEVIAPEVHGTSSRAVTPGKVHVGDPEAQAAKETAAAVAARTGDAPMAEPGVDPDYPSEQLEMPAVTAKKEAWVAYASALGAVDPDDRTKAELIELYGPDAEATTGGID